MKNTKEENPTTDDLNDRSCGLEIKSSKWIGDVSHRANPLNNDLLIEIDRISAPNLIKESILNFEKLIEDNPDTVSCIDGMSTKGDMSDVESYT